MLDGGLFAPIIHFVVSTPLLIQPKALYIFDSFQACRRTNLALSTALAVRNRIESTKEESHDVDIAWKRTKTYGTNALNDICCIDSLYKRHVPCSYKCPKRAAEPLVLPELFLNLSIPEFIMLPLPYLLEEQPSPLFEPPRRQGKIPLALILAR